MSGLLPSTPDLSAAPDPDPRVIGLDSDDAADLVAALSSDTARSVLTALHDEPATPSAVAERVDTSLQNAQYHLEKLEAADLIEEVDTIYSEKGREMSVYAPTNGPLVVFPGSDEDALGLERLLKQAFGAILILGIVSALIEAVARGMLPWLATDDAVVDDVEDAAPDAEVAMAVEQPAPPEPHWLVELVMTAPPGLVFFLGGCLVVLFVVALAAYRRR